jgi:hypothetical protein
MGPMGPMGSSPQRPRDCTAYLDVFLPKFINSNLRSVRTSGLFLTEITRWFGESCRSDLRGHLSKLTGFEGWGTIRLFSEV